jgi:hypothetical protein
MGGGLAFGEMLDERSGSRTKRSDGDRKGNGRDRKWRGDERGGVVEGWTEEEKKSFTSGLAMCVAKTVYDPIVAVGLSPSQNTVAIVSAIRKAVEQHPIRSREGAVPSCSATARNKQFRGYREFSGSMSSANPSGIEGKFANHVASGVDMGVSDIYVDHDNKHGTKQSSDSSFVANTRAVSRLRGRRHGSKRKAKRAAVADSIRRTQRQRSSNYS